MQSEGKRVGHGRMLPTLHAFAKLPSNDERIDSGKRNLRLVRLANSGLAWRARPMTLGTQAYRVLASANTASAISTRMGVKDWCRKAVVGAQ